MFRQTNFTILLTALTLAGCSSAPTSTEDMSFDGADYQKASWGMNKEQIKLIESNTLYAEQEDALLYKGEINGNDSIWFYEFTKDEEFKKLVFVINEKLEDDNDYVNIFFNTAENISKDYGEPTTERFFLNKEELRPRYSESRDHWGEGVRVGDLEMSYGWEKANVGVRLELMSDDPQKTFDVSPNSDILFSYQVVNMDY